MGQPFTYNICDVDTGKIIAGGKILDVSDPEAGFARANEIAAKMFPNREIHIQEISVEEYHRAFGLNI